MISMRIFVLWSYIFLMHHTPIKTIGCVTDVIEIPCWKNQLPSITSKRSHHLITLLMLIGMPIQQGHSLQRWHRLIMQLILWLIKTLSCRKMVRRICELMVTLDFNFRLVLCSHEDVSFNIIFLNVLEGIIQFNLSMWFKKKRLETPFKGDNVNS